MVLQTAAGTTSADHHGLVDSFFSKGVFQTICHESIRLLPNTKKPLMTHATAPDAIMQLGCPYSTAKTPLGSVESRLLAELAKGPRALDDDRPRLGLHEGGVRD
jgi:hypothetical protein